jgi:cell wall-associated NlpC family hydrolase
MNIRRKKRFVAVGAAAAIATGVLLSTTAHAAPAQPRAAQPVTAASVASKVVSYAKAIERGHHEPGWHGGKVPYSWGGGHAGKAHPTLGTCVGYTGSIRPCPANHTKGVDCSGFTRWVYSLAVGRDVFGPGNTNAQIANRHLHRVKHPTPGDLTFYGASSRDTHHVGIYIGHGKMIDALRTGTSIRTDSVHAVTGLVGYYHYR